MSFSLSYLSSNNIDAYIQASIHLLNDETYRIQYIDRYPHYKLFQKNTEHAFDEYSLPHRALFDRKEEFFPQEKLTIRCKMFLDKTKLYFDKIRNGKIEEFDDFGMLYQNKKLSDVTMLLENGEKKLTAHKYILAKKSSVFAAMFQHDMLENRNNEVRISDISTGAIEDMLHFIYTDFAVHAEVSDQLEVLKAADKYAINDLKKISEDRIKQKITIDNCLNILEAADHSNSDVLKVEAVEYVTRNATILVNKPQFGLLKNMHSDVMFELLQKVILRLKNQNNLDSSNEIATKRLRD